MKASLILTISFLATPLCFLEASGLCQSTETGPKKGYGYVFVTPGVVIGHGTSSTVTIGGGGEGLLKDGLGASADLSYLFFPREGVGQGFGLLSPGLIYQFRAGQKTVPFVTGGYTLAFRSWAYNLVHFGGGMNHWFGPRWGIRLEGRDHIDPRAPEYNFLEFRVGLLLR